MVSLLLYRTHQILTINIINKLVSEALGHTGDITKASKRQVKELGPLIDMVEFSNVDSTARKSIYAKYPKKITKRNQVQYRLDNEGSVQQGAYFLFRVQSDEATYAAVLIQSGYEFGVQRIKNAFLESLTTGMTVTLSNP
jgi:hypothetical protein